MEESTSEKYLSRKRKIWRLVVTATESRRMSGRMAVTTISLLDGWHGVAIPDITVDEEVHTSSILHTQNLKDKLNDPDPDCSHCIIHQSLSILCSYTIITFI